jgi:hypothetical protein
MGEFSGSLILTGLIIGATLGVSSYSCHQKWSDAGYEEVKFDIGAGCRVKKDGKWITT